jgi:hypothetical protein
MPAGRTWTSALRQQSTSVDSQRTSVQSATRGRAILTYRPLRTQLSQKLQLQKGHQGLKLLLTSIVFTLLLSNIVSAQKHSGFLGDKWTGFLVNANDENSRD